MKRTAARRVELVPCPECGGSGHGVGFLGECTECGGYRYVEAPPDDAALLAAGMAPDEAEGEP